MALGIILGNYENNRCRNNFDKFIKENPYFGIAIAILSIIAGIITILESRRQRKIAKDQQEKYEQLFNELETYRYLFSEAQLHKQVKSELNEKKNELHKIHDEITTNENKLNDLDDRIAHLGDIARKEIVKKELEQKINTIVSDYNDFESMKKEFNINSSKLQIPPELEEKIKESLKYMHLIHIKYLGHFLFN